MRESVKRDQKTEKKRRKNEEEPKKEGEKKSSPTLVVHGARPSPNVLVHFVE